MTTPRIGITGITRTVSGADRTGVNAAYVRAVLRAGGVPLVLSPLIGVAHNGTLLDALDGLVLSGGEDVDPAHYGQAPHPDLGAVDPLRDAFELAIYRDAAARRLPVLAICRGIQLVNVALGGTLWQDIPSERPEAMAHAQGTGRDDRTHPVDVTPGSRLARALGNTRCEVNSFHHQSIRDLAPGLLVTARAPDGEIEGVETADGDGWLLAVQWHPEEFHQHGEAPDHGLFDALIREARRGAAPTARSPKERGPAHSAR
ncbi:MAG: gamma-glutamyl-gamma-aminobutyrate hydrolase family protein [Gemmatimonadales bacterium]|nr:gamma-glutamyl-gamma-aminobutyrate hydrolase family protein [Gemmatimonadales bacterium]